MENKLKNMFEYQKFANNSKLAKIISDCENAYGEELNEDMLFMVNAAGEVPFAGEEEEDK